MKRGISSNNPELFKPLLKGLATSHLFLHEGTPSLINMNTNGGKWPPARLRAGNQPVALLGLRRGQHDQARPKETDMTSISSSSVELQYGPLHTPGADVEAAFMYSVTRWWAVSFLAPDFTSLRVLVNPLWCLHRIYIMFSSACRRHAGTDFAYRLLPAPTIQELPQVQTTS